MIYLLTLFRSTTCRLIKAGLANGSVQNRSSTPILCVFAQNLSPSPPRKHGWCNLGSNHHHRHHRIICEIPDHSIIPYHIIPSKHWQTTIIPNHNHLWVKLNLLIWNVGEILVYSGRPNPIPKSVHPSNSHHRRSWSHHSPSIPHDISRTPLADVAGPSLPWIRLSKPSRSRRRRPSDLPRRGFGFGRWGHRYPEWYGNLWVSKFPMENLKTWLEFFRAGLILRCSLSSFSEDFAR